MQWSALKPASLYHLFPLPVTLGAQLAISHFLAALVALALVKPTGVALALVAALLVGLALTFTLQRSLTLLNTALREGRSLVSLRGHVVLSPLMERVNGLLTQAEDVSNLRKNLIRRVQDTAAQQERNRLARDLHDSIKQQIFSIHMSAAAAQARWTHDPDGAKTALEDVRRSAQEAMVEMNALLQQLAPAPLEKVGLVQALRDQCEALGYRASVQVQVEIGELPDDDRLPAGTQQNVFRIAQEALSNIARHARVRQVTVFLGRRDDTLALEIADDGQGFDVDGVDRGMGLTNLGQRVLELGGTLVITSSPGAGTVVRAAIPFVEALQAQEESGNMPINHTLNKVSVVGLVGGLALIAVLYYPLYVLLPRTYLADWGEGSPLLGIVLQAVAAVVAVGIGYVAARWSKADSRRGGMLFGAFAGGIAGAVLFIGVAGAAAGVVGSSALVLHGVAPAANENEFLRLLAESVIGTVWWVYAAFWGVLVAGISLGAIGGLLAKPSEQATRWSEMRFAAIIPLNVASLASAYNLLAMFALYHLLEPAVGNMVTHLGDKGVSVAAPSVYGVSLLPVATALLIHIVIFTIRYAVLRTESRGEYAHILFTRPMATGVGYAATALIFPGFVVLLAGNDAEISVTLKLVVLAGFGVCLLLSGMLLWMCWKQRQEQQAAGQQPAVTWRGTAVQVGIVVALAVAMTVGVGVGVGLFSTFLRQPIWLALLAAAGLAIFIRYGRGRKALMPTGISIGETYNQSGAMALQAHVGSIVTSVMMGALVSMSGIAAPLTLVLIPVVAIVTLVQYDHPEAAAAEQTMSQLVQTDYVAHLGALIYVFIVIAVVIGLLTLLAWGILRWTGRRTTPRTPAVQVAA